MNQQTIFKQTEIGMIPEDWDVKELQEEVDVNMGQSPKSEFYNESGEGCLFMQGVRTFGEKYPTFDTYTTQITKEAKAGGVLFSVRAPVGEVNITEKNLCIGRGLSALNMKNGNNEFLYYLLKKFKTRILNFETGSVFGAINGTQIKGLKLPFPEETEQKSIAKILSDLDSKIELLQKQNKTLEAVGQAIFKHWFVDFEFPNEEGKPYKSSGGEMGDSELGEIPKGWRVKNLGEFLNVIKGCSYKSEDLKESDKALITLKSINRGGGFNQKGYKEYVGDYKEEQIVKDGDIVVAQTDLTQAAEVIGTPAIVNSLNRYNELIASLDLQILRIKEKLNKGFAYFLLKTAMFHNYALSYTNGTTVLHLNKKAVPDFKFTLPNENILGEFGKIAEQILEKGDKNEKEVYILSQIRDSLLPKLMSGEIRVGG